MAKPAPSEKVVFLALQGVFTGQASQIRCRKAINKVIQKYEHNVRIRDLLNYYGMEPISCVAKVLLEARVFESNMIAKERFPDVFDIPVVKSVQPATPKPKVTVNNAAAVVHCIKEGCQDTVSGHQSKAVSNDKDRKIEIGKKIQRTNAGLGLS
jgi:hypothetical protein